MKVKKYVLKKYKKTFDSLEDAYDFICERHQCAGCPLEKFFGRNCLATANNNPEAAKLMGVECIEVDEERRLTESELAICKVVGAKWLTRNILGEFSEDEDTVELWTTSHKPFIWSNRFVGCRSDDIRDDLMKGRCDCHGALRAYPKLFPSVKPGDCINVEEMMK